MKLLHEKKINYFGVKVLFDNELVLFRKKKKSKELK